EKTVKFHLTNIYKKMNVKSRAQLIVWCLPHLGFVESEARMEATQPAGASAYNNQATQTIPAGNATVAGTTLPGAANGIGSRGNGNSDLGSMGA
ncbi:MAG: helix-turn-helix transcriptional regulator, partial [Bdellovibrionota bacterium]